MTQDMPDRESGTPSADETPPTADSPEDPATLQSAEDLDQDRIDADPLEEGMDPSEHWSGANRHGTTPFEEATGEPLDRRLAQEEPDVTPEPPAEGSRRAVPDEELDSSVDERPADHGDPDLPEVREPAEEERGTVLVTREGTTGRGGPDRTVDAVEARGRGPEDRAERIERPR
ncbi:MAG TPA: hypothetical protein VIL00_15230 [Pseudonocardiaceae bacterium]